MMNIAFKFSLKLQKIHPGDSLMWMLPVFQMTYKCTMFFERLKTFCLHISREFQTVYLPYHFWLRHEILEPFPNLKVLS